MTEVRATMQVEHDGMRISRYDLAAGDRIPWHRHDHDYLVIPLTDGVFEVTGPDGTDLHHVHGGEPYRRDAGTEHELRNGERPYSFIEIEFTHPRSR
jgi:beta-alanine degradation protein BauB